MRIIHLARTGLASLVLWLGMLSTASVAMADVRMEFVHSKGETSVIMVHAGVVRIEDSKGPGDYILLDGDFANITVVNEKNNSYHHMSRNTVANMERRMERARDQMLKQLEALPPEQREAMLKEMPDFLQAQENAKPKVLATEKSRKLADIPCSEMLQYEGETLLRKYCVSSREALKISADDYQTLERMLDVLANLGQDFTASRYQPALSSRTLGGIPIMHQNIKASDSVTLRKITTEPLDDALFRVPSSYQLQNPK